MSPKPFFIFFHGIPHFSLLVFFVPPFLYHQADRSQRPFYLITFPTATSHCPVCIFHVRFFILISIVRRQFLSMNSLCLKRNSARIPLLLLLFIFFFFFHSVADVGSLVSFCICCVVVGTKTKFFS